MKDSINISFCYKWADLHDYKDHLGNTRVSFKDSSGHLVKTAETAFDPWGLKLMGVGSVNEFQNRWELQGKEAEQTFGLNRVNFGARVYNPTIGRWDRSDPLADHPQQLRFSPYVFSNNNPVNMIDHDGRKPVDVFKQTADGGYVKVSNQGGNRSHTYINNNGTTSYYNVQTGSMRTVNNSSTTGKIAAYKEYRKEINNNVIKGLDVVDKIGDGLSIVGTVAAPFTEGTSLTITAIGEGVSLGAKTGIHALKLSKEGATTENKVNLAVDAAFVLLPAPIEKAVERSGLDNVSKKIIVAEIKQGTMAAEKIVKGSIEKSREKNGQ